MKAFAIGIAQWLIANFTHAALSDSDPIKGRWLAVHEHEPSPPTR